EMKAMAQKYAQRLELIRKELLTRVNPKMKWMPPEVSSLIKGTRAKLVKDTFTQGEAEVAIDETLDLNGWDIPRLMRMARDEWGCLTWLCWAAGSSKVSMPAKLAAPKDFGQAAGMSQQRLWRAGDLRVSGPREVDGPR